MMVRMKLLNPNAKFPKKAHTSDACVDIYTSEDISINKGETKLVSTGLAVEIPRGYEGQIRPRSGLSRDGLLVHFGTIDSGYRGEIKVCITNLTSIDLNFPIHTRIAQIGIRKAETFFFKEVENLSDSDRGENGHGSTGLQ